MYHLLKGFYQYYKQPPQFPTRNILILGLDNAGKSTLLEMIKSLYSTTLFQPDNIRPTIGQNIGRITVGETVKLVLAFWDLGGQESLRKIWEEYYRESDALIFVVDATDRGRIEECKDTLGTCVSEFSVLRIESIISHQDTADIPVLMLANKQDMPNSLKVEEIQQAGFTRIAEALSARDSKVLPISALTGYCHYKLC
jgi:ADP-ribosylation factor related protein 1